MEPVPQEPAPEPAEAVDPDRVALETLVAGGQPDASDLAPFEKASDAEPAIDDQTADVLAPVAEIDPGNPLPPEHWEIDINDPRDSWED